MKFRNIAIILFAIFIIGNGFTCKKKTECDNYKVELSYDDVSNFLGTKIYHGTAPYNYTWSDGMGTGGTRSAPAIGIYSVTVTDANGCVTSASIHVP
jgi:hypothetical protein